MLRQRYMYDPELKRSRHVYVDEGPKHALPGHGHPRVTGTPVKGVGLRGITARRTMVTKGPAV